MSEPQFYTTPPLSDGRKLMWGVVGAHAAVNTTIVVRQHGFARFLLMVVMSLVTMALAGLFFWNTIGTQPIFSLIGTGAIIWVGVWLGGEIVGSTHRN
jgi:hypothetical protein